MAYHNMGATQNTGLLRISFRYYIVENSHLLEPTILCSPNPAYNIDEIIYSTMARIQKP